MSITHKPSSIWWRPSEDATIHGHRWLFILPLAATAALVLIGRGKTLGLLAAAATAVAGVLAFGETYVDPMHALGRWDLRVEHLFAFLGHAFLFVALLPLAPAALSRLASSRQR